MQQFLVNIINMIALLAVATPEPAQASRRNPDVENIGARILSELAVGLSSTSISIEKEVALGARAAQQFEHTNRLLADPIVSGYIDQLGQRLAKRSDAKVPIQIKVVDSPEINAFAFAGGYLYVNYRLILVAENEAELAGVIAHDIAHVAARHVPQLLASAQELQVSALAHPFFVGHWAGQTAVSNLELALTGRQAELEADQLALQYLWNSGYDPGAFVTFLNRLVETEKSVPLGRFVRTEDRITAALDELRYLPERERYLIDSSEFEQVKAQLFRLRASFPKK